jgi:hypothetical protein
MKLATVAAERRGARPDGEGFRDDRLVRIIEQSGAKRLMETMNRFRSGALLVSAALLTGPALSLGAESLPTRPIRVLVPQPPGGSTDAVARLFAKRMVEVLGQQIVIDNRAGGGVAGIPAWRGDDV